MNHQRKRFIISIKTKVFNVPAYMSSIKQTGFMLKWLNCIPSSLSLLSISLFLTLSMLTLCTFRCSTAYQPTTYHTVDIYQVQIFSLNLSCRKLMFRGKTIFRFFYICIKIILQNLLIIYWLTIQFSSYILFKSVNYVFGKIISVVKISCSAQFTLDFFSNSTCISSTTYIRNAKLTFIKLMIQLK